MWKFFAETEYQKEVSEELAVNKGDNVVVTGDNKGEWAGQTWIYMKTGLTRLINDRVDLVKTANGRNWYANSTDEVNAQKKLDALGINWSKSDIAKLPNINGADDLLFPHMYLVPELCAKGYVIKGIDDNLAAKSDDPEYVRGFSVMRDRERRKEIAAKRREAISGTIMPSLGTKEMTDYDEEGNPIQRSVRLTGRRLEDDPAYQKYRDAFIDEDILRKVRSAQVSGLTLINTLKQMRDSVNTIAGNVRTSLLNIIKNDEMDPEIVDLLYKRFLLSTQSNFMKRINSAIEEEEYTYNSRVKPYADKMFRGKEDPNSPVSLSGIRQRSMPDFRKPGAIAPSRPDYYRLYVSTIKIYSQLMATINAFRRGNQALFDSYIAKLREAFNSYSSAIGSDATEI